MPQVSNLERTKVRYGGLCQEIVERGLSVAFVDTHSSYIGDGMFIEGRVPVEPRLGHTSDYERLEAVKPLVVRDLTMPQTAQPIYEDVNAPVLVHHPSINDLLRSKSSAYGIFSEIQPISQCDVAPEDLVEAIAVIPGSKVVVKPDVGAASEGVVIGDKTEVVHKLLEQKPTAPSIVQEYIDMSHGIKRLGIESVHNLRFIVIGGAAIFGFVRSDTGGSLTLERERFDNLVFNTPEVYGPEFMTLLERAVGIFSGLRHASDTVLAYDFIEGVNAEGEIGRYLLEVNRRPLRNSPYDSESRKNLWASHRWDVAEADLLARKYRDVALSETNV